MSAERTHPSGQSDGLSQAGGAGNDVAAGEMPDRPLPASLSKHAASGVLWTIAQKCGVRVTGLVTLVILARQVGVADFGVVAAAAIYVQSLNVIADLGFASYIVQAERVDRRMLSTAVWFSGFVGVALAGLTVIAAPFLGHALGVQHFGPVLQGLAPAIVFTALAGTPMALLRRRLAFRSLAVPQVVSALSAQAIALALALTGAGVWALVAQYVMSAAVTCLGVWVVARWRPSLQFSPSVARTMASYGVRVIGSDLVGVLRGWIENVIILSVVGVAGVGYWNIAMRLISLVTDTAASTMVSVSSTVFAQIKNERQRVASAYLRACGVTLTAIAPLLTLLAAVSPVVIPLLYGAKWEHSIVLSQVYALAMVFVVHATLSRGLFLGIGRPGIWLVYGIAVDALNLVGTALAAPYGMTAVAIAYLGVVMLAAVTRVLLVARVLGLSVRVQAFQMASQLAVAVGAAAPVWVLVHWLDGRIPAIVLLVVAGLAMATTVLVLFRFADPMALREIWAPMPRGIRRLVPAWVRRFGTSGPMRSRGGAYRGHSGVDHSPP
ncbi:lipopolysaccharide biosynthesis protein [Actinopolymorpha pittospori]